jgi:hypothetical protein
MFRPCFATLVGVTVLSLGFAISYASSPRDGDNSKLKAPAAPRSITADLAIPRGPALKCAFVVSDRIDPTVPQVHNKGMFTLTESGGVAVYTVDGKSCNRKLTRVGEKQEGGFTYLTYAEPKVNGMQKYWAFRSKAGNQVKDIAIFYQVDDNGKPGKPEFFQYADKTELLEP